MKTKTPADIAASGTADQDSTVGDAFQPADPGTAQQLYLIEPGDTAAISVDDINQGQLADCFLLSSIGEIVLNQPSDIASMIHDNGDGTETVTLYVDQFGALPSFFSTQFKPVTVTVDNSFPSNSVNNGSNQAVVNGVKEIWPQILEKAVATLEGGYNAIANGGSPVLAMEELTGHSATPMLASNLSEPSLQSDVAAGDLIVFDTPDGSNLPYNLVGDHAYMFDALVGSGSSAQVELINPWGFDQPGLIPLSQIGSVFAEIDVGQAPAAPPTPQASFRTSDISSGVNAVQNAAITAGTPFEGEFVYSGSDNLAVSTTTANVFIQGGSGDDAIEVSSGTNVIDGGLGSNFLVGGAGTDAFYMDGRGTSAAWDTLVNFHAGDTATLYGFDSASTKSWVASAGAPGYTGPTLQAHIGNAGTAASITFAGLSATEQAQLVLTPGSSNGASYLMITAPS